MALRRELVLVLVVVLAIAVGVKLFEMFFKAGQVEASDASKFVLEDLRTTYPGADIAILSTTPKYNGAERYFEVKARVTEDQVSPCPRRSHIFYNYPVQNFVPQPPEVITGRCNVCMEGICTIAFPEEAVIASHTFWGTGEVQKFITSNDEVVPSVSEKSDSWIVRWDSPKTAHYYVVEVHRNGSILGVQQVQKAV